jgi:hypothetical protein
LLPVATSATALKIVCSTREQLRLNRDEDWKLSVVSGLSFRSTGSGNLREIIKKLRVVLETYFR